MRATAICLVCSVALLAACSKKPAEQASATASAAAPAAPVLPFTRPHPKAGLWRMAMATDSGPGIKFGADMCLDAATEGSAFAANPRARSSNCDPPKFSANPGGGVVFDEVCKVNQRTITSHGVATGDFSSAYAVDVTTTMDPPLPGGAGGGHTHIESHWVGPCPAGQKPGQMTGLKFGAPGQG